MKVPEYSNPRARLVILFCLPFAFSLLFFAVSITSEHNESRILNIDLLHATVGALSNIASDVEDGEDGFLLTGDEQSLVIFEAAKAHLALVRRAINSGLGDPAFQPRIESLLVKVEERVRYAEDDLNLEKLKGREAAVDFARAGSSMVLMDNIRRQALLLQLDITKNGGILLDYNHRLARWSFFFFLFGTGITLLVMVWLYRSFVSYMESRNAYMRARDAAHVELRALNADLERRIDLRTRELQQFNEELQQFAYVASHDLQEPLRTVTSFAQLLMTRYQGKLDADADEFISYIVNSARRMTDLINGLLALARLRKAGQPGVPIPLETLVEEARVSLQAAIHESGAKIEVGLLPRLIVDRVQFSQVFQNLLSNAIKYRSEASPAICISAKHEVSHWIVSIKDNGRGFDPQFAERIFGLFQRLHGREVDGTGMGLSIARRIVERHGGRMWAESEEGAGATFFLSLPVSLEVRSADAREAAHEHHDSL
jgi:signal transduction histidine kinase